MTDQVMTAANIDIPVADITPKRMYSVRDRCVIVKFQASRWSNTQSDLEAKGILANTMGAEMDTFNVSKQKLAKKIVSRISKFYSRGRDLTKVPKSRADGKVKYDPLRFGIAHWNPGEVLVPVERYVDMEQAFETIRSGMKTEIKKLRGDWDQLLAETKKEMGAMFDPSVIPTYDEFVSAWDMSLSVCALPELDPRITLDDLQLNDVVNQIKNSTMNRVVTELTKGWRNAAESLLTSLEYAAAVFDDDRETVNKLNDPDGTQPKATSKRSVQISESLFENLKNQLATVRALAGTTADKGLEKLCDKVQETLGNVDPNYLRTNPAERRRYATATKSLVSEAKRTVKQTRKEIEEATDELSAFA